MPARTTSSPLASVRRALAALSGAVALAAAGFLTMATSAQASLINLKTCNSNTLTQAFLPWGDPSYYELAPGGTFSDSSWTLSGGAQIVPGGEPFAASGTLSANSASLPAGSSAQSPSTCVDAAYPTIRFFVDGTGTVAVSVVWNGLVLPAGVAVGTGSWAPSPIAVTLSPVLGVLGGGTAQVSIRLTALTGDPVVDDVFIDPYGEH